MCRRVGITAQSSKLLRKRSSAGRSASRSWACMCSPSPVPFQGIYRHLELRNLSVFCRCRIKGLAEKELALSAQPGERLAVADGWWDLAEKEKSPLRKGQMQRHCRSL